MCARLVYAYVNVNKSSMNLMIIDHRSLIKTTSQRREKLCFDDHDGDLLRYIILLPKQYICVRSFYEYYYPTNTLRCVASLSPLFSWYENKMWETNNLIVE